MVDFNALKNRLSGTVPWSGDNMEFIRQKNVPLPPRELMFMGDDHERMLARGRDLVTMPINKGYFNRRSNVMDIGCGYGRFAYGLMLEGSVGAYWGLDILKRHTDWLAANLKPKLPPGSDILHLDVANSRYNPGGAMSAEKVKLPKPGFAPDLISLLSVFTHLYPAEVEAYVSEIAANMSASTVLYSTFFLINDEQQQLEAAGKSQYPMPYRLNEHTWHYDQKDPLWAIGFAESWVRELFERNGLEIVEIVHGTWCGRKDRLSGQDTVFVRKRR